MEASCEMSTPGILILGMHRSGTSLVAQAVHLWGAYGGPAELFVPAGKWNPDGYWEHAPLVRFNDRLLAAVGATWFLPPSAEGEVKLQVLASDVYWKGEALGLIAGMQIAREQPWFWKDPRLAITLPFWTRVVTDPLCVIVARHPRAVARSLAQRDRFPVDASLLLWSRYVCSILAYVPEASRRVVIDFERMLAQPADTCHTLAHVLHRWCGGNGTNPEIIGRMAQAVRPNLNHHSPQAANPDQHTELTMLHQALYERLRSADRVSDLKWDLDILSLPVRWREELAQCLFATLVRVSRGAGAVAHTSSRV
jgi:hypothetical protein